MHPKARLVDPLVLRASCLAGLSLVVALLWFSGYLSIHPTQPEPVQLEVAPLSLLVPDVTSTKTDPVVPLSVPVPEPVPKVQAPAASPVTSQLPEGCVAPKSWTPDCGYVQGGNIMVNTADGVVQCGAPPTRVWGNALSLYWMCVATAQLTGYRLQVWGSFQDSWLSKLPMTLPAPQCSNPPAFQQACKICNDGNAWQFGHQCSQAWPAIRELISNLTLSSLMTWASESGNQLPVFKPTDAVIQFRCATDTVLSHDSYGPAAFSFYKNIPPDTKRVLLVYDPDPERQYSVCKQIATAMEKYVNKLYPKAEFKVVGGDRWEDFARLALAPVLFKDSQSSFGLWAAVANRGTVFSVPLLLLAPNDSVTKPDLGSKYKYVDTPVLYPHVGRAENITIDRVDKIIEWLETH